MDEKGNKEVKSIYDFDHRIQAEHNLYLGYTKKEHMNKFFYTTKTGF